MPKTKRKIIWAIDPFEEKNETQAHVIEMLRELSADNTSTVTIDPVYVLTPDEYEPGAKLTASWLKQIRPGVEAVLKQYIEDVCKELKVGGIGEPLLIVEKHPSLTRAVQALSKCAIRMRADTILVGTHAKTGLSRVFLGSFAETLLLHSQTPVLVVGPHARVFHQDQKGEKAANILFSTDFGPSSSFAFKKVIGIAKVLQSKVVLFHCLPHAVKPFVQSGLYLLSGGYVSFPEYVTENEKRKRLLATKYVNLAKKHGVQVEVGFNLGNGNTADAIVEQASIQGATMIAMAAESGPVSAALIGSVTRQVVRSANCPVWVLRSE